ncbi:sugar transporter [Aspergillus bombycis]|uniref:Sugar transporter n=1 Tax=Aspergillus bombycis TaxID=109264 RepID=A0A1F7ZVE8_9EURO|nr:sugar transporter [Aspergillus bombycis]OGM43430.1 sugar transporter [Aspergillus bombycis]
MAEKKRSKDHSMEPPEPEHPESAGLSNSKDQGDPRTLAEVLQGNRPDPWGSGYRKLYYMSALVFLCSTMNGYDTSLMGSINALPNYTEYYNLPNKGSVSTGIVFSIFQIGQMAAEKLSVFIGGRFLLSFFATCAHTASPLLLVEIAPPQYRASVAGMYNTLYYVGSILATSSVYGAHLHLAHRGHLDWRLPLWLQMVCPGIVCLGVWFVPESPRWLIAKDRHEEAQAFIVKYHANGDASHPIVALEMNEMRKNLHQEGITRWRDFFDLSVLVKSRSRRYRLMLNLVFSWFGQFSGNKSVGSVISYYLPTLLKNVGVTNTDTQLLLNIIYALTGWVAATIGTRFHDIVGRRKMFLGSTAGMVICLAVTAETAAVFVHSGSTTASSASIAFIYIFGVVFAFAFTSMQPIYPGEVMSNDMRAKGMGTFKLTAGAAGFVNTFAAPIALADIGYWFYVFFVFWDCFEFAFIYLFFVETKGRTLEELEEVFQAPNPRKASLKVPPRHRRVAEP